MGGKKKPTLSQLAKRQEKQQQQAQAKPAAKGKRAVAEERPTVKASLIDQKLLSDVEKEVIKWEYVTPYLVATRFNTKISVAYQILRALASKGTLVLVSKGHRTEVYTTPERLKQLAA
ncbi:30S ribosomal protein S25e [Vulcanisaeta distributa]|uniref:30S ribosomal protein S25e n=1 Tax=Vulcanisaeta distributa (strain DSM 14429 / JCM 11212 / NBRC 100878 / IC-017) TaxID=572478 RepID=E1QP44_VULDI|nr:30S ribosomal protein S25e [Vulcanisaeta distributa]ADN50215.1 30S ribosomal protein S25e [Vulcanisaeta distributa DSM 14429]